MSQHRKAKDQEVLIVQREDCKIKVMFRFKYSTTPKFYNYYRNSDTTSFGIHGMFWFYKGFGTDPLL